MEERLAQLYAEYEHLKPRHEELTAALKSVIDGIKLELTLAHPGVTRIDVVHPSLTEPLVLRYVVSPRVDTKRLKAEAPDIYAAYAAPRGWWELARAGRGRG
jgi:predicted phage-related endonuclease